MTIERSWLDALRLVVEDWRENTDRAIITSPDVDGIATATLVAAVFGGRVIGFYTTQHVMLFDGATPLEAVGALWLDHDISEPGVRCIGQHLIDHRVENTLPRRHPVSFNPNRHFRQTYQDSFRGVAGRARDKYPFGTIHMITALIGGIAAPFGSRAMAILAHADGSWSTPIDYPVNAGIWRDTMFPGDSVIESLCRDYTRPPEALAAHHALVGDLEAGGLIRIRSSRVRGLDRLDPEWVHVTGRQGVNGNITNFPRYLERFNAVSRIIASGLNVAPSIGSVITSHISGRIEHLYPNSIRDFDSLMMSEPIFSHAFKDQRTLRYTTDLVLRP